MRIGDVLEFSEAELRLAGIGDPMRDARWIVADVLGRDSGTLRLFPEILISETELATIQECIRARTLGQPVAQIIGKREFWGRDFRVSSDTLDPRPETEQIIAAALGGPPPTRILDLGTGTGCLLLTLLAEFPDAIGIGTDISDAALSVAEENAATHRLDDRATFVNADWLTGVEGQFDLIVSNPPYIPEADMGALDRDVRDWEPHLALTPGGDGLDSYRRIASAIATVAAPNSRAILEFGAGQETAVAEIFATLPDCFIRLLSDMDGRDRVVIVEFGDKPGKS